MPDTPFIHCMETPLGYYVFDVNANQFLQIPDEPLYRALQTMEATGEIDETFRERIERMRARGYLSSRRPSTMRHGMTDSLQYQLDHNIEQITIQLTQQCNFRCSYCTYAPKDFLYQREHTAKRISWETAKAAVDFFLLHSQQQIKPAIGFYGGEPLLEFEQMKRIIDYAEAEFAGKEVDFSFTTNGSLLTEDIARYLCERPNIDVMISLDGAPDIHNRSRKFAANGKGTFSAIASNIRMIRDKFPSLFAHLHYNVVIDARYDCAELHRFFNEHELFRDANVQSTLIDDSLSPEKTLMSNAFLYQTRLQNSKVLFSEIGRYPKALTSHISANTLNYSMEILQNRLKYVSIRDEMSHSGPCIPGQKRLFVNVDGNLYPCERVSEISKHNILGNVRSGFDYECAKNLLNIVSLTPKQCSNCWALAHCMCCAKYCDNNGELSSEYKLSFCHEVKRNVEISFRHHLLLFECKRTNGL